MSTASHLLSTRDDERSQHTGFGENVDHPNDDFHAHMDAYFDAHQALLQPQSPGEASRPTSPALIDKLLETVESKVPSSIGDDAPNITPEQAENKEDTDVSQQAGMGIDAIMMQAVLSVIFHLTRQSNIIGRWGAAGHGHASVRVCQWALIPR